jgi:protein TonB
MYHPSDRRESAAVRMRRYAMPGAGYFEQKRGSPTGLAIVVALHAGVLGALILVKGPQIMKAARAPLVITSIEIPDDPPPIPEVRPDTRQPQRPETVTQTERTIVDDRSNIIDHREAETTMIVEQPRPRIEVASITPAPVRRQAELIGSDLQPPYPASEERAQRSGSVQIRVTIGANGRVIAADRVSATSDAFYAATERQALRHWRFRPATVDGRPIEATRVMTVTFRIQDAG